MICPDCRTVFLRVLPPDDESALNDPIYCPTCGRSCTAAELGSVVFPSFQDAVTKLLAQVKQVREASG